MILILSSILSSQFCSFFEFRYHLDYSSQLYCIGRKIWRVNYPTGETERGQKIRRANPPSGETCWAKPPDTFRSNWICCRDPQTVRRTAVGGAGAAAGAALVAAALRSGADDDNSPHR